MPDASPTRWHLARWVNPWRVTSTPFLNSSSRKQIAITNPPSVRIILVPPGLFAGSAWRPGEEELLSRLLRLLLSHPEMVVVEDAQRLDDVGDSDPAIADKEQVFS